MTLTGCMASKSNLNVSRESGFGVILIFSIVVYVIAAKVDHQMFETNLMQSYLN